LDGTPIGDVGYAGYFYHANSGLNLTLYRAYDPDAGRWLNRDLIGEAGGLNLYDYVGNNPVNYYDPLGLEWQFVLQFGGTFIAKGVTGLPAISVGVGIGFTTSGQLIFKWQFARRSVRYLPEPFASYIASEKYE